MTRSLLSLASLLFVALLPSPALGQAEDIYDERAHALFEDIRCPVCDGQSIAESDVLISISLRAHVLDRIEAGDSDGEIKSGLVERYGDDILFEPAVKPTTFLLWAVPWLGAIGFILFIWSQTRSRPGDEK